MLLASLVASAVFVFVLQMVKAFKHALLFISADTDLELFHFFYQEFSSGVDQEKRLAKLERRQTGITEFGETLQR